MTVARTDVPHADAGGTVAVVGAGIAGLAAARALARAGLAVHVFEKARGPGGRAATRLTARDADGRRAPDALAFDHGAQYATARDARFAAQLDAWAAAGIAAEWTPCLVALAGGQVAPVGQGSAPVRRVVGVPGMQAFGRALADEARAAGASLHTGVRVAAASRAADGRRSLADDAGGTLGGFDAVLVAVPAPQAAPLLADAPALAARAAGARITPCWSVLLGLAAPSGLPFNAAFVNAVASPAVDRPGSLAPTGDAPSAAAPALSWIARDDTKPGRTRPDGVAECWVLHGAPGWSAAHLELAPEEAARRLLAAFAHETRLATHPPVAYLAAHRWRYATPDPALDAAALWDDATRLGACGDWCGGPRVEGAYLSGLAAAERVLDALAVAGR